MPKSSGLGDNLYVAGFDLSGDIGSLSRIGGSISTFDVTGIDKLAHERIGGQRDGSIEYSAFFNDSANQAHAVLSLLPTTDQILTYCRGTLLGSNAACLVGKQINYDPDRSESGELKLKVQALANGFGLEWGNLLTAGKRTDVGPTTPGASLDNLVETLFSGQAYLQVFAFTGTDATITVRGASDSGFTTGLQDQCTFVVNSAPLAARSISIPTVRRFLKINTSTTGGFTNLVFSVVFVRNLTAVAF